MKNVVNLMEEIVENILEEVLKEKDICQCDICKRDMYALALNNLKPMYATTEKGQALFNVNKASQQGKADILAAVIHAVNVVSQNRQHP